MSGADVGSTAPGDGAVGAGEAGTVEAGEPGTDGAGEPGVDHDGTQTGRASGRLALALAVGAALVVALELRDLVVAAPVVGAVLSALAVQRVRDPAVAEDVLARTLAALGWLLAVVGVLGLLAVAAAPGPLAVGPSPAWAAVVVALGAWVGLPAVVVLSGDDAARDRVRSAAWTATAAGAALVLAVLLGVDDVVAAVLAADASAVEALATSPLGAILALPALLVFGVGSSATLPGLLALGSAVCGALLLAVVAAPPHVVLGPRAASDARLRRLTNSLLGGTVLLATAAVGAYALGLGLGTGGPVIVAVRALLVLVLLLALLGGAAGTAIPRVFGDGGRSPREVLATALAGGLVATVVLVALSGPLAPAAVPAGALWPVAVAALAAVPTTAAGSAAAVLPWLRSATELAAVGALLLLAVGAAVLGAVVAPVAVVVAAVGAWDALALRRGLRSEVPGADTAAVERVRLAPTLGLAVLVGLAALALHGGVALVAPSVRGQPLVVVVVGAAALAAVTVAAARSAA